MNVIRKTRAQFPLASRARAGRVSDVAHDPDDMTGEIWRVMLLGF
jgi:hypothetical protein